MSVNLQDIAISTINRVDYRCIINWNSKIDALNLLKNADLTLKREHYKNIKIIKLYHHI